MATGPPETGTPVVLQDEEDEVHLFRVPEHGDSVEVDGVGVLAADLFEGRALGEKIRLGRSTYRLLAPTPELVFRSLQRRAQVIRPPDAARIAHATGVGPGTTVVEGGVGSGALTAYLAFLVGETGHVHGFEMREDHLAVARSNLQRAGLDDRVTFHEGDLGQADVGCEVFLADVPDPAAIVPAAERCLEPAGRIALYTPLVSQMEAAHEALADHAFTEPRSLEQLERRWVVHDRGSRPDFQMLGHTGFLTVATRIS